MELNIESLPTFPPDAQPVEIVERKGLGHPDTLCDALAEQLSMNLCRYYQERFGLILHHNVDKVLLYGGAAKPAFGGGEVVEPFEIYLAGRATREFGGVQVPVQELAVEGSKTWLQEHLHAIDPNRHIKVHCLIRPGSVDLVDLFLRQRQTGVRLANDTSCGAGFAPLSELEQTVLRVETQLNSPEFKARFPAYGEDIKIMGVRNGRQIVLTVACAMVDGFIGDLSNYLEQKRRLAHITHDIASKVTRMEVSVRINTGDDEVGGQVYLTVTGTSAEAGDDGQVGRGNRANGLITPYRPMTLEAAAGKNPITHVGKLYNVIANRIAEAIVADIPEILGCHCYLVSQIGRPITDPQIVDVKLHTSGRPASGFETGVRQIVSDQLERLHDLWQPFIRGELRVY